MTPIRAALRLTAVARPSPRDAPATQRGPVIADAVRIVAGLSIAAGLIHAVAMVDHFGHWWAYGAFFMVLTYGQVLWGVALLRGHAGDRALIAGALANAAIIAVWVLSRTVGIAVGPDAGSPEPLGTMDIATALVELGLIAYAVAIVRPSIRGLRGFRALLGVHRIRFAMMLGSASFFAALLGGHQH
ncbi:MAG: hypothetical protein QOJ89_3471 [bacterium]